VSRPLLRIEDLRVDFVDGRRRVQAVQGVDLQVGAGEAVAVVGESGSGKSVTALAVLGLLPRARCRVRGRIELNGEDLLALPAREMRRRRGRTVALVPQDPLASLNPVHRVGDQLAAVVTTHAGAGRRAARARVTDLLADVGIPDPAGAARRYPHELSGGQRQRVLIAMALAGDPALIVADEPTTALDVTVQAQVVQLLVDLTRHRGTSLLWISHDLGVVAGVADRVAVMYAGRILEHGPAEDLLLRPAHPYTHGLLQSLPRTDEAGDPLPLTPIPAGPIATDGCAFAPRCAWRAPACDETPVLRLRGAGAVRCVRDEPHAPRTPVPVERAEVVAGV
jgi:oligopeptide/dipeptide ABC transporter ATP-binding protein